MSIFHDLALRRKLLAYSSIAKEVLVAAVAGFALGFMIRIFGKTLSYLLVGGIIVVCVLYYQGFIVFDQDTMVRFIGLGKVQTLSTVALGIKNWLLGHIWACVSAVIAFFIGWKLGS